MGRPNLLVPPPPKGVAHEIAAQRRSKLQRHLAKLPAEAARVRRFLETPWEGEDTEEIVDGSDAAAEVARLRWQLGSDERLLLERAIDVLERYVRKAPIEYAPGTITVSLEPLPLLSLRFWSQQIAYHTQIKSHKLRLLSLYPWWVVIRCPEYLDLWSAYSPVADWLGIAVCQAPQSKVVALNHCRVGSGGLEGVVGGNFDFENESVFATRQRFSVTCRHVIAEGCGSLRFPSQHEMSAIAPDAVLLSQNPDCFAFPDPDNEAAVVLPARESDIVRFQVERAPLKKHHPQRSVSQGYVKYPVSATNHTGQFIRFPHYAVRAFRHKLPFGIPWPLLNGSFAGQGDSGSWVLEEGTRIWLGMIVAGYDDEPEVLVVDGESLLDYFSTLITGSTYPSAGTQLSPKTWK